MEGNKQIKCYHVPLLFTSELFLLFHVLLLFTLFGIYQKSVFFFFPVV